MLRWEFLVCLVMSSIFQYNVKKLLDCVCVCVCVCAEAAGVSLLLAERVCVCVLHLIRCNPAAARSINTSSSALREVLILLLCTMCQILGTRSACWVV